MDAAHQHSSEIALNQALRVLPHPEMLKYDKLLPQVFSFALDQLLISAHRFFLILGGGFSHSPWIFASQYLLGFFQGSS